MYLHYYNILLFTSTPFLYTFPNSSQWPRSFNFYIGVHFNITRITRITRDIYLLSNLVISSCWQYITLLPIPWIAMFTEFTIKMFLYLLLRIYNCFLSKQINTFRVNICDCLCVQRTNKDIPSSAFLSAYTWNSYTKRDPLRNIITSSGLAYLSTVSLWHTYTKLANCGVAMGQLTIYSPKQNVVI